MALINCKNCGKIVSDKAKACPHCGAPVTINDAADKAGPENPMATPEVPVVYHMKAAPKNNTALIVFLVMGVLALLGAAGWLWHDYQQKRAELERQLAEKAEQARQDSIAAAELREQLRQDSIARAQKQEKIKTIYNEYVKVLKSLKYKESIHFFLFDITKDGIPELWIDSFLPEDYSALPGDDEGGDDGSPLSVLTVQNNAAKRVFSLYDEGCYWPTCYYQGNDYIIWEGELCGCTPCICKISYQNGVVSCKTIFEDFYNKKNYPKIKEPKVTWYGVLDFNTLKRQIQSYFQD